MPYKDSYEANEFAVSFRPVYPLIIGKRSVIRITSKLNISEISVYLSDQERIKLASLEGAWAGDLLVPETAKEGWQPIYIYIRHKLPQNYKTLVDQVLDIFSGKSSVSYKEELITRRIWIRAFKPRFNGVKIRKYQGPDIFPNNASYDQLSPESFSLGVYPLSETVSPESNPLLIKGSRIFTFASRNIEGSREGFVPGSFREGSLRLTISGKISDMDINANFFETSSMGTTQTASREEKVSILLKRGSTEAYFGDFIADLSETEFSALNRSLSGVKLSGKYEKFGFNAIASTPQGTPRSVTMYGNGTQGPYNLGLRAVVDSERVRLDGVAQRRGSDYEIDYNSGTITFKDRVVLKTQIIEVDFDSLSTLYRHSTYALRGSSAITPNFRLGLSWINDSDQINNAQSIPVNAGIEAPKSHFIAGADGQIDLGEIFAGKGEVAYSQVDPDLTAGSAAKDIGKAGKIEISSKVGPISLNSRYKRIGPKFTSLSESLPRQDLTDWGGVLSIKPNGALSAVTEYSDTRFIRDGAAFKNNSKKGKISFAPPALPALAYTFDEYRESNDPVPPYSRIDRITTGNYCSAAYNLGKLIFSSKTGQEVRFSLSPSGETTIYRTTKMGISTSGLDKFASSFDLELKDSQFPSGLSSNTKTCNLSVSSNPTANYSAFGSFNYTEDSQDGISNVTDLSYKAAPSSVFNTDGKVTVSSLKETFGTTEESTIKSTGSFKLELRPHPIVRARYYFKPNFTLLNRTRSATGSDQTEQYELNLTPSPLIVFGASAIVNSSFTADKTDIPFFTRKSQSRSGINTTYTLKSAPFNFMSIELNQLVNNSHGLVLLAPASAEAYQNANNIGLEFNATARTALSERIAVDLSYSNKISKNGTLDAGNDQADAQTLTGAFKLIFNPSEFWSFSLSYSFSRSISFVPSAPNETYLISPGIGLVYRLYDRFRLESDYNFTRSVSGIATERSLFSLRCKYDLSEYIHISSRYYRETSAIPDYKTTDLSGYVEINL